VDASSEPVQPPFNAAYSRLIAGFVREYSSRTTGNADVTETSWHALTSDLAAWGALKGWDTPDEPTGPTTSSRSALEKLLERAVLQCGHTAFLTVGDRVPSWPGARELVVDPDRETARKAAAAAFGVTLASVNVYQVDIEWSTAKVTTTGIHVSHAFVRSPIPAGPRLPEPPRHPAQPDASGVTDASGA